MDLVVNQFDVWLTNLEPTQGREISKIRPCVIVSSEIVNKYLKTVIICPFTSTRKRYFFRVNSNFNNHEGQLATDQIRSVDLSRLVKKLGVLDEKTAKILSETLVGMFEY